MPDKKIEDLLKQALHKRNMNKAEEAVKSLGTIAKRKGKLREEALQALHTAALECPHDWARWNAFGKIGEAITADDAEYLALLEEHLESDQTADFCSKGLLRVKGKDIYGKLIAIIADKKYENDTRQTLFDELSRHAKQRFHLATANVAAEDMTEADFRIEELKAWETAGFPDAKPITLPEKELKKLGITLPEDYAKFLLKHFGEEYEYDGEQWRLLTADGLLETVTIDDQEVPAVRQLVGYAKTLEDVMEDGETEDHKGKPYPLSRLAKGVAIGSSSDGGVLYLDPADDNAVWWFHPDGGDVERLSKTFKTWLNQAEQL